MRRDRPDTGGDDRGEVMVLFLSCGSVGDLLIIERTIDVAYNRLLTNTSEVERNRRGCAVPE